MKMRIDRVRISRVPHRAISGEFSIALVGDLIYLRPMSSTIAAQQPGVVAALNSADLAFGNLETNIFDLDSFEGAPQAESGGTWLFAQPQVAQDIRALGFDMVSLANNHAADWGVEGLLATMSHLDASGLVHAGAGRTMSSARLPSYVDAPLGRVALVSATATFTTMSPAADPLGMVPGRPGVSTLEVSPVAKVSPAEYDRITRLASSAPFRWNRLFPDSVMLMGGDFVKDDSLSDGELRVDWSVEARDRLEILSSVRQAAENANFVVFSFHTHEPSNASTQPAPFAVEIAHAAVEAGADVVVCHGPHQLRGIEIYKGAPIFYSLGNFATMGNSLDAIPQTTYDVCGVDSTGDATVPEILNAFAEVVFGDPNIQESAIAVCRFHDGVLRSIELTPLDLGIGAFGAQKGIPTIAADDMTSRIAHRLEEMSAAFGVSTRVNDQTNTILVDL